MKTIKTLLTSVALMMLAIQFNASGQKVTNINVAGLKAEINSLHGFTRIVFIGDPVCPGCVASANDLRNHIFNQCKNPDLRGLIVWLHVSGFSSTMNSAIAQSSAWSDTRVSFYWDSLATDIAYAFGYQNTWSGCNYAWDISMIYPDTTTWTSKYPPAPFYCISKTGCCNTYNILNEKNQLIGLGECSVTAITEYISSQSDLKFFPNPVSDFITLSFESKNEKTELQIFNSLGESVIEIKNEIRIDVSDLPIGIYLARVKQDDRFYSVKFVKE